MEGFGVFTIVLIVIWILSGIANMINKQKEAERRRMLRQQMGQAPQRQPPPLRGSAPTPMRQTPRGPRRVPARAAEAPPWEVARPPVMQAPPRRQQPPLRPPVQPKPVAKRPKNRAAAQVPVLMEDHSEGPRTRLAEAPPVESTGRGAASPRISASTMSRWLQPQTLNQQFVLTEIFQPPLAMRDRTTDF